MPQPPRQLNHGIAPELERICLKCLAREQLERYATAADLVDDLKWWQTNKTASHVTQPKKTDSEVPVRPQGLRSFSADHADFFLSLLPGPLDREGLPESVSFWKRRIDSVESDAFPVGVMFGPSGCGKSSLVSAGLLPRLSPNVLALRQLCTVDQTESDLVSQLHAQFPKLAGETSLAEMFAQLRDDGRLRGDQRKVLIVLDQMEQWLHGWDTEQPSMLVSALRHCNGRPCAVPRDGASRLFPYAVEFHAKSRRAASGRCESRRRALVR